MTNRSLKALILKVLPNLQFSRPHTNKCEHVCSVTTKNATVGRHAESQQDSRKNLQTVFWTAHFIRQQTQESCEKYPWVYDESLTGGHDHVPTMLRAIIWWILNERQEELKTENRSKLMKQASINISQTVMYQVKTKKQVSLIPIDVHVRYKISCVLMCHCEVADKVCLNSDTTVQADVYSGEDNQEDYYSYSVKTD